MNRFRKALHSLTTETQELDAGDLKQEAEKAGATVVADCPERIPITVYGVVRSVTIRPRAGVPALEAELYDGSGTVSLVFLGRRVIAGLDPGRKVRATGRITTDGRKLMYNPRYELIAAD